MNKLPIGVAPYTIRDAVEMDYAGSLVKISQLGYKGIEIGPPPDGMTVEEQKSILSRCGLEVIGTHAPFNHIDFNVHELLDYVEDVGGHYLTISMKYHSKDDVLNKAQKMNRVGEMCRQRNIQFLYHNHNWEFESFDGEYILDILLRETDPELVKAELDTYWIKRGGEDPVQYMNQVGNRCPLLHIKDMEAGEGNFFAEIGEGILDFCEITKTAERIGVKWLIVEQDECRRDPFESLQISYANLIKMGLVEAPGTQK
ncbi:sugar phosphate isomerase/epimerase [Alicyclobacillus fastidiosus]|uniref:Sugar phosphate isomerase/epimerase n=1 Tax=Alicyclobacillus fastidiosus TaxID=392011 RepID=A0ABY6ZA40_9BACL|nr:sugar phosphate isomerase/epimerase [Alicyclobacillus fastidiosus]WAH39750.1 sugar phosphate isomerase/epimerase [Alicyclobacillus fastidiosus]GMA60986.1 sugar phosphate isomerase [Alicyclobacillus fastidiosus]